VPWLMWLVADLSPWGPRFLPVSVHVADKVAVGQVSLRVPQFSPVNIIPLGLCTCESSWG
jgi:hypothetical protein